jgi:hypothetical protein
MSAGPDPTRQYSDREVRLILKAAAELRQRRDHDDDTSGGMMLAQPEQVAAEAGLDPRLVRRAAADIGRVTPPPDHNAFLGAPTVILLERVVDTPIDVTAFDQLLDVTRSLTREVGEVSTIGRQFGWRGRLDGARSEVSVSAIGDRTTVRIRVELDEAAVGQFMLKGMLFGGGGGLIATGVVANLLFPAAAMATAAAVLGGSYLWSRRGLQKAASRYGARANELLDRLVACVREAPSSQGERSTANVLHDDA